MKKKSFRLLAASLMAVTLVACGKTTPSVSTTPSASSSDTLSGESASSDSVTTENDSDTFHIGIVTGSFSQSEDDRRGAEAFQEMYGSDVVTLAIYPDDFSEDLDTTIQTIVSLAEDPDMKAIIVNQAVDGTTEAFRQIHEMRPDIICIAGEAYEDFCDIEAEADLVVNCDFVNRGYLIIRTAHELGCDTFVHISFPRHLSYETVARRVAIMEAACEEFGMTFAMEEAPDPTTEVGVPGAQSYITDQVPEWTATYGENTAYFCTNDAHTEPLIKGLMEYGGYFIEADLPSPSMGYPGALDLDLIGESGDYEQILSIVEEAVVENGGAGRFGTWTCSYGYSVSAGLAQHARNVLLGESELNDINDMFEAFATFSSGTTWNGSTYVDVTTGDISENVFLIYQDTYIMGDPGYFMGSTEIEVPEEYFTID